MLFRSILSSAKLDFKEINQIRIPGGKRLNLGENLESLGIVRMNNLVLKTRKGILTLLPVKIQSKQGDVAFVSPLSFHVVNEPFAIQNLRPDSVALRFDSLNIGKIIATPDLGVIDGNIKFSQFTMLDKGYALNGGQASINALNLLGYQYQKIAIKELSIQNYTLKTAISINDPNAQFEIHGNADIDGKPNCQLNLDISKLNLSELGLVSQANTSLMGIIELNAEGKNMDNLNANISMETVEYKERNQKVGIEFGELNLTHTEEADELKLRSSIADLDFKGKINPATIADDILYGISRVVPNLVQVNKPVKSKINNEIDAKLTVRDAQEIADLFAPGLRISPKATLVLKFNANED